MTGHTITLTRLADRIREVADLPADEAMVALAGLLNGRSPDSAEHALKSARRLAAADAVAAAGGSRAAVCESTGVAQSELSRLVTGAPRSRRIRAA